MAWQLVVNAMASLSGVQQSDGSTIEPLRAKCWWITSLGVIYVLAGLIALSSVALATAATVLVVGIMMLIAGIAEVINAFQVKTWGKFLLWMVHGVLYIVAGFIAFENPLLVAALLTLMLGMVLVVSGVLRIILAFNIKRGMPWAGVAFSGMITVLLGGVILAHWPVSGVYIIGMLLGIDLVFAGTGWVLVGLGLRPHSNASAR